MGGAAPPDPPTSFLTAFTFRVYNGLYACLRTWRTTFSFAIYEVSDLTSYDYLVQKLVLETTAFSFPKIDEKKYTRNKTSMQFKVTKLGVEELTFAQHTYTQRTHTQCHRTRKGYCLRNSPIPFIFYSTKEHCYWVRREYLHLVPLDSLDIVVAIPTYQSNCCVSLELTILGDPYVHWDTWVSALLLTS